MNIKPDVIANEILREHHERPVDVANIAKQKGLRVDYLDLDAEISGFLITKDQDTIIGVNKNHHINRQRFTIGHELGHYLLHQNNVEEVTNYWTDNGIIFFRDGKSTEGTDLAERQANQFAAALLMPTKDIKDRVPNKIRPTDEVIIKKLAADFEVSQLAMTFRLTNLRLLQNF